MGKQTFQAVSSRMCLGRAEWELIAGRMREAGTHLPSESTVSMTKVVRKDCRISPQPDCAVVACLVPVA